MSTCFGRGSLQKSGVEGEARNGQVQLHPSWLQWGTTIKLRGGGGRKGKHRWLFSAPLPNYQTYLVYMKLLGGGTRRIWEGGLARCQGKGEAKGSAPSLCQDDTKAGFDSSWQHLGGGAVGLCQVWGRNWGKDDTSKTPKF